MNEIHIACTADDKYLPHLAAMLHSVRWHEKTRSISVHYLCSGAAPKLAQRRKLERFATELAIQLHWVDVPPHLLVGLPSRAYLTELVWYRIFMPRLLPDLDRVLYLDADVIAMASVAEVWSLNLGDHYFAAVTNAVPEYFSHRAEQLGVPGAAHYFNAGVALWNLARLRQDPFEQKVLAYARENREQLLWLEQDVLNALFYRQRLPLHPRWNCQNGIFFGAWGCGLLDPVEVEEARHSPGLLHFEGGSYGKPWHYLCTHPLRDEYAFHRGRTPWRFWVPEGLNPLSVVRKHLGIDLVRALRHLWHPVRRMLRK